VANSATLVLLPGMDGTGDLFDAFIAKLGPTVRTQVVRFPADQGLGYARLAELARLQLPNEGDIVLLGESFSGPIAVSLAAGCGARLKGLVLCCSFVRNPRPGLSGWRALIGVLPIGLVPMAAMNHVLLGRFTTAELRQSLGDAVSKVSVSALRARMRAVMTVDVRAEFARVDVPVLYLRAPRDRLVPAAAGDLARQVLPRTRVVDVDAPHCMLQAAAADAARHVAGFLHELGA
jgi:pimeloyl-ACP methyl ester carboxylesterase